MSRTAKNYRKKLARKAAKKNRGQLPPDYISGLIHEGVQLHSAGHEKKAEKLYRQALNSDPDHADANHMMGVLAYQRGDTEQAVEWISKAIAANPNKSSYHNNLANALKDLERLDEAIASYKKAIAIRPDSVGTHINLGDLYEKTNQLDKAETHTRKVLEIEPGNSTASIFLAILMRRRGETREAIQALEALLHGNLSGEDAYILHFELGKLYDLEKDSTRAFEHFTKANQVQAETTVDVFNADVYLEGVEETARALTPGFIGSWHKDAGPVPDSPVFLVGFPRSGTTLLDQILDGHPRLQVMEERPALDAVRSTVNAMPEGFPSAISSLKEADVQSLRDQYFQNVGRYITREPGTILVDKFPLNICNIPLILRLFPDARFILALRHPFDVVLSNFMQHFTLNNAMANFLTVDGTVRLYNRVMNLWLQCTELFPMNFHTIKYEDLVDDFESEVRGLLQFLELEWNDAVLNYRAHAHSRERIKTPSYEQVTEPIYQRAKFRWMRYEDQLRPFIGEILPLVEAFGYDAGND